MSVKYGGRGLLFDFIISTFVLFNLARFQFRVGLYGAVSNSYEFENGSEYFVFRVNNEAEPYCKFVQFRVNGVS